ncbi:hypothetical protein QVD17_38198 [Tagetes erecta]|uniref:Uncharacterized protein n=1 Tax=Tagetes erecta TaxID=13708 RepID=A0AAD8JZN3_TARER|nr:hypothetical protein QVD17_38198 [Tagetes erecta]
MDCKVETQLMHVCSCYKELIFKRDVISGEESFTIANVWNVYSFLKTPTPMFNGNNIDLFDSFCTFEVSVCDHLKLILWTSLLTYFGQDPSRLEMFHACFSKHKTTKIWKLQMQLHRCNNLVLIFLRVRSISLDQMIVFLNQWTSMFTGRR